MTNDDDVAREWADMHAATVDGLRRQGWSRCDAVIEADEREAGAFADKEASRATQDKAD